jgi:hypothetical protein
MIHSHSTHRLRSFRSLRPKNRGNSPRRLGIELMESRWMLSTTTADLPAAPLGPQYSVPQNGFVSVAARNVYATASVDGGYINLDSSPTITRILPGGPKIDELTGASISGNGLSSFSHYTNHSTSTDTPFIPAVGGDGLQPGVIVTSGDGIGLEPNIRPIVAPPLANGPGQADGGTIPIHTLLTDLQNDERVASQLKSQWSVSNSTPTAAAPVTAISGEWARAMVFEIAGGEPAESQARHDGQSAKENNDDLMQHDEPLSITERHRAPERSGKWDENMPVRADGKAAAIGALPANESVFQTVSMVERTVAAELLQEFSGDEVHAGLAESMSPASSNADEPTIAALNSAFDHFAGNAAKVESSSNRDSWSRWFGVSPLPMILALARIAAANSRRASAEERVAKRQFARKCTLGS